MATLNLIVAKTSSSRGVWYQFLANHRRLNWTGLFLSSFSAKGKRESELEGERRREVDERLDVR